MLKFIWDENKNLANLKKHGVDFNDAVRAWYDPDRLDFFDMPELTKEQLARFVPAKLLNRSLYRPVKIPVKINYDAKIDDTQGL